MSRILLDQNVPRGLRHSPSRTRGRTASQRGWSALENGDLLRAAEAAGFDVIVTADQNVAYQQNIAGRMIAVVVIGTNHWDTIRSDAQRIAVAVGAAQPGHFMAIDYPQRRQI